MTEGELLVSFMRALRSDPTLIFHEWALSIGEQRWLSSVTPAGNVQGQHLNNHLSHVVYISNLTLFTRWNN